MAEKLVAYCLDWHASASSADDILVDPLADWVQVELRPWNGESLAETPPTDEPTVFYMFPPPAHLAQDPGARITWIPMWDHARIYSQDWWDRLPRTLRVVALSGAVHDCASSAGLETLDLRYHLDPSDFPRAEWEQGRVGCYWNRTGLLSPGAIERLCRALSLEQLLFRNQLDPRVSERMGYELPSRLGNTEVEVIRPTSRREYLEMTLRANIYIAPREAEGVGLTFLEAMARGCCVLGFDAPTMNEYIRHGENGLLFKSSFSRLHPAALVRFARRSPHRVNVDQPWKRFADAEHPALGEQALRDQAAGHSAWLESLPSFRSFLLDW